MKDLPSQCTEVLSTVCNIPSSIMASLACTEDSHHYFTGRFQNLLLGTYFVFLMFVWFCFLFMFAAFFCKYLGAQGTFLVKKRDFLSCHVMGYQNAWCNKRRHVLAGIFIIFVISCYIQTCKESTQQNSYCSCHCIAQ